MGSIHPAVWIGFLMQVGGNVLSRQVPSAGIIAAVLILAGVIAFVYGCMQMCEAKGYSKWLGLLGLLTCIGLLVIILLPQKN
jgi:cobalamin biosynthesis protein CobD/CbiB